MEIINRVRVKRIEKGLTLEELARAAGIGRSTLGDVETGESKPLIDTVLLLARALGCEIGDLFALVEETHDGGTKETGDCKLLGTASR